MLMHSTYNLMPGRNRGKLCTRSWSNFAEALEDRCFDLLQLPPGVAILHVGYSNTQPVCVVIKVKLPQGLQSKKLSIA